MVPGGFGTRRARAPNPLLDWIARPHATSQWTTSVCTAPCCWPRGHLEGARGTRTGCRSTACPLRCASDAPARGGAGQVITAAVCPRASHGLTLPPNIAATKRPSHELSIEYDPQRRPAGSPRPPRDIAGGHARGMGGGWKRDEVAASRTADPRPVMERRGWDGRMTERARSAAPRSLRAGGGGRCRLLGGALDAGLNVIDTPSVRGQRSLIGAALGSRGQIHS